MTLPTEPMNLNTIIEAFAGLCILFVLRAVMESRDKVRAIWAALHGELGAVEPNGLVRQVGQLDKKVDRVAGDLKDHSIRFDAHVQDEGVEHRAFAENVALQNDRTHKYLGDIEKRIDTMEQWLPERKNRKRQP